MAHTIFVSDLHLCAERAAVNRVFFDFLLDPAAQADALYILGDLFEYWAGDDDSDDFSASVTDGLRQVSDSGVKLFLMHGNRDFLMGERLAASAGAVMIGDPTLLNLYGTPTLLLHGDTLCTDDIAYQQFRTKVRDMAWQKQFLDQPLARRKQIAEGIRAESTRSKELKTEAIMDVTTAAVESTLRMHDYPRMIHGHTHRPALHWHMVDGRRCERWVLADWYTSGSYLRCDADGCVEIRLPMS